ncbi:ssDNA endonuclease and repair protein rad10 [Coemansia sp. RSA 2526]|nr:ssDNA endonuclease and repair protein rad10 [Coemansia sp. RSA 475]KAJ2409504.1 ssDNA endonuclease and repair protein rad10 [Coemansia sp. RSA 2526]
MSGSSDKTQQPKRRFHIPTAEELEKRRVEAKQLLSNTNIQIDMSTSILKPQHPVDNTPSEPTSNGTNGAQPTTTTATAASPTPTRAPSTPTKQARAYTQMVQVNELQRGNPLLSSIRNVRWTYSNTIIPDFEVGRSSCILYLSIKYHRLHPEYISQRIEALGRSYTTRVLLVYMDTDDSKVPLREINRVALLGDMTLLLAWSLDEAGRYVETLKAYEHKQPDIIRERVEDTYVGRLNSFLTSIRSVNKTDVLTLASNFKSMDKVACATVEELAMCPGIGELKAQRIYKAFNDPFVLPLNE